MCKKEVKRKREPRLWQNNTDYGKNADAPETEEDREFIANESKLIREKLNVSY